jgi:hypothetical protein
MSIDKEDDFKDLKGKLIKSVRIVEPEFLDLATGESVRFGLHFEAEDGIYQFRCLFRNIRYIETIQPHLCWVERKEEPI